MFAESAGSNRENTTISFHTISNKRLNARVDWNGAFLAGPSLDTAKKRHVFQVYNDSFVSGDAKSGIAHNQDHFHIGHILMLPEYFEIIVRKRNTAFGVIINIDGNTSRTVDVYNTPGKGIFIHLMVQVDNML